MVKVFQKTGELLDLGVKGRLEKNQRSFVLAMVIRSGSAKVVKIRKLSDRES
jgi:hypothetical protein